MSARLSRILFASFLLVTSACGSSDSVESSDDAVSAASCAQEIALDCGPGLFDGCLEPGLTRHHVCVAEADRGGQASCAQEVMRLCPDGLEDACLARSQPSNQHICIATSASSSSGGTGARPAPGSCAMEIALDCPEGSFDGCLEPGLTNVHVCVADESRGAELSCVIELLQICEPGFTDACGLSSPPSSKHVCVAE